MSTENLNSKEAREKLKDLAESIDFAMLASDLTKKPLHVIPMSTKKVDDQGNIWFLTSVDHEHVAHIQKDNDVHLIYSKPGNFEFLNVYGKASIVNDKTILETLYQSSDDSWFDGKSDPKLRALSIKPMHAYYWNPKSNKFISLIKMGYGAVTGNKVDISQEGNLNV